MYAPEGHIVSVNWLTYGRFIPWEKWPLQYFQPLSLLFAGFWELQAAYLIKPIQKTQESDHML